MKKKICWVCKTIFEYSKEDVKVDKHSNYVECPKCEEKLIVDESIFDEPSKFNIL